MRRRILGCLLAVGGWALSARAGDEKPTLTDRIREVERRLEALGDGADDSARLTVRYANGLIFANRDRSIEIRLHGRINHDYAVIDADSGIEAQVGGVTGVATEFRRARIGLGGRFDGGIRFLFMVDFAGGGVRFKNMWIEAPTVFGITARIGYFREHLGLESTTSANYITFLERALPFALTLGRGTGVMFHGTTGDRVRWFAGAFMRANDIGEAVSGDGYDLAGRVSVQLWGRDRGEHLAQVGAGYAFRHFSSPDARLGSRPEAHLAPVLVDTGRFSLDRADVVAADAAVVHGPWSLQAEYVQQFLKRDPGDGQVHAWYAQASVFLTGEHRVRRTDRAAFHRVSPRRPFGPLADGGWGSGAFELAARVSAIDLDSGSLRGGRLTDYTAGVNWYLNAATRVQCNAVVGRLHGVGTILVGQIRFAIQF